VTQSAPPLDDHCLVARAGEHGRGFSVVATEVRRLSTATDEALSAIRALAEEIEDASRDTARRVHAIDRSLGEGAGADSHTSAALDRIVTSVGSTRQSIAAILEQAATQEANATRVADHMRDIAGAARDMAGAARDTAASAAEASTLAIGQTNVAMTVHESTLRLGSVYEQLESALAGFRVGS
jgi:methyl-accepting chemotaxis protein